MINMKNREKIFKGHYNLASGKQADEIVVRHMTWVQNAMQEYADQQTKALTDEIEELKSKLKDCTENYNHYVDKCFKLESRISELENGNKWISVKDRLPEIGDGFHCLSDDVLILMNDGEIKVSYYDLKINDWIVLCGKVTHWMPLPNKPKTN